MKLRIEHNLDQVGRDLEQVLGRLSPVMLKGARFADVRIMARAIGTYMQNAGVGAGPRSEGDTGPLRIVSGDLARGLSGKTPGGREVRVAATDRRLTYTITILLAYAAIHEEGGTITVPVTARMRRFFWAKFAETWDERYKAMALSKKQAFTVRIPARPYLAPALRDELPAIENKFEALLEELLR